MKLGIVILQRLVKFVHNSILSFHQTFLSINCAMWSLGLCLIYYRMEYSQRMSEVLYVGLCRDKRIGTPTEVAIRREMMDMEEIIERPVYIHRGCMIMKSGSHREGFRFTSSDRDIMCWPSNFRLICDQSQFTELNSADASRKNILLIESSECPPGFVKLQLLTQKENLGMFDKHPGHIPHGKVYLSSHDFLSIGAFSLINSVDIRSMNGHGPVNNFNIEDIEFDVGICLACHYWPPTASSWIERCKQKGWPMRSEIEEIKSKGCHMMPIGVSPLHNNERLEWRLSFSLAEQKLVYSMNHTQFLCYGLLKLFLKEVLPAEKKDYLICSYFLKTILFWGIQNNPDNSFWCPSNLLPCFWACFKHLILCVLKSNCPNFFIQENNMFKRKIDGSLRKELFSILNQYYELGEKCLLKSITLNSILSHALCSPLFVIPFIEGHSISENDVGSCVRYELYTEIAPEMILPKEGTFVLLNSITTLLQRPLSQVQSLTLQYATAKCLVHTAFTLASQSTFNTNKSLYRHDRKIINMLKLASTIGPVSQLLYLGIYYYSTGRYRKALTITKLCRQRLSKPYVTFNVIDKSGHFESTSLLSWSDKMNKSWMDCILFLGKIAYLKEMLLESSFCKQTSLFIPPFVMLHMLFVLSNHKLRKRSKCQLSLTNLQTLLHQDDGRNIPLEYLDISWQILGICQYVVGDLHEAMQSYKQSMKQKEYHKIQDASIYRIEFLNRLVKKRAKKEVI